MKRNRQELKVYRNKKKYKKDKKRMLARGYDINTETMTFGELKIEYTKNIKKTSESISNKISTEIISLIDNEKRRIMTGDVTSHGIGYISGLEKALEIINIYSNI